MVSAEKSFFFCVCPTSMCGEVLFCLCIASLSLFGVIVVFVAGIATGGGDAAAAAFFVYKMCAGCLLVYVQLPSLIFVLCASASYIHTPIATNHATQR